MIQFKIFIFLFVIGLGSKSLCQTDSVNVFSYDEFLSIVKMHHPLSYQANLRVELGEAYLQKSRGGFDPKLMGSALQKYFDGKQYYSYLNGGLKVPTWFGLSLQGGVNQNTGVRLNNESYTNDQAQWFAGITANLGNGLFIDQRRADLKQAKILRNSTELEQRLMINQLLLDASIAYFDWFKAYNKTLVFQEAVVVANERFENTKQSAELGDKAYLDTLKALIQFQDRSLKLEQTRLDLTNKENFLETFLWQDGFVPLELSDEIIAPRYDEIITSTPLNEGLNQLDTLVSTHPDVLMSQNKIDYSKIDYRLQREALKPTLQLKYNALSSDQGQGVIGDYSIENYNWGAKLVYPIFTFKERANVNISRIKLENEQANLAQKEVQVKFKIIKSYNSWLSSNEQVDISNASVSNYFSLFNAEVILFNAGESSMFLVNVRDQNYIDARLKLIELIVQNFFFEASFNYQTMSFR